MGVRGRMFMSNEHFGPYFISTSNIHSLIVQSDKIPIHGYLIHNLSHVILHYSSYLILWNVGIFTICVIGQNIFKTLLNLKIHQIETNRAYADRASKMHYTLKYESKIRNMGYQTIKKLILFGIFAKSWFFLIFHRNKINFT